MSSIQIKIVNPELFNSKLEDVNIDEVVTCYKDYKYENSTETLLEVNGEIEFHYVGGESETISTEECGTLYHDSFLEEFGFIIQVKPGITITEPRDIRRSLFNPIID